MKVDLTDLSPVKKSMSVEVAADEVAKETETVLRNYAKKAKIPGFRPGKAPLAIVRARFASEVQEDVRERVVSRSYREATRDQGLQPLGDPILDEINFEDGEPLTFKTTFEVLPEVKVGEYKGIEAKRPPVDLSDSEIDEAMEELRQSRSRLVAMDGAQADVGDVVVADVEGAPDGGEPFNQERAMIEVGATTQLPAFNDSLIKAKAGDTLEFNVDYPAEYGAEQLAGKTVAYKLAVHEIKRREVPELDDEFAKDLGEFDDLAALRARLVEDLTARKEQQADGAVRQAIMDKLLLDNPLEVPELLVDDEIKSRLQEIVRRMMMQGMDPEKVELDWKKLREQQVEPARKSVQARLLLDAVAEAESIEVPKAEIDERIRQNAERMGEKPEKLRRELDRGHGVEVLKNQMVREKSLDLLIGVANISNEE